MSPEKRRFCIDKWPFILQFEVHIKDKVWDQFVKDLLGGDGEEEDDGGV